MRHLLVVGYQLIQNPYIHLSDGGYMYVGSVDCGGNFNAASSGDNLDIVGELQGSRMAFLWAMGLQQILAHNRHSLFLWRLYISIGIQFNGR